MKTGWFKHVWFLHSLYLLIMIFMVCLITGCYQEPDDGRYYRSMVVYPELPTGEIIPKLSHTVRETSGLIYINGQLWTLNDSGHQAQLYQLDSTSGDILRIVTLINAFNHDWESLNFDDDYVYIGNTGNNKGVRKNLSVYRIDRKILADHSIQKVEAEEISYRYEDQKFFPEALRHNFDCEALIPSRDSIYLITKNRSNYMTHIYVIPNRPGEWIARRVGSWNSDGQITEATQDDKSGRIVLLGYIYYPQMKKNNSFIWIIDAADYPRFWKDTGKRWNLDLNRQTEAITFIDSNTFWISAEKSNFEAASIFQAVLPAN